MGFKSMKKVVIISVVVFVLIAFMLVGVKLVQNKKEKQGKCGCSGKPGCNCIATDEYGMPRIN